MYIVYIIYIYTYIQWDVTPLFFEISPRSPPAMNPSWDALLPMTWPRNLPMALSLLSITASAPSRMALATSQASAPRRHRSDRSHWENLRTLVHGISKMLKTKHFKISSRQWKIPHWVFNQKFPVISLKWPWLPSDGWGMACPPWRPASLWRRRRTSLRPAPWLCVFVTRKRHTLKSFQVVKRCVPHFQVSNCFSLFGAYYSVLLKLSFQYIILH